jgi:MFS family permease
MAPSAATLRQRTAEAGLYDQTNLLKKKQLLIVFSSLAASLFICYADQNGIGTILPTVGRDFHATNTISWAGTSSLIANTVTQVMYARISDIYGRKPVFLFSVAMLVLADILCGVAPDAPSFYFFRALGGIAGAGINSLTMMIVSDIVTLEQRGKYQGFLGAGIGGGNAVGPLLSAAFSIHQTWRAFFWFLAPCGAIAGMIGWFYLPSTMPKGNARQQFKLIDWAGIITATTAIVLILIPLSGGGSYFSWSSPMVIAMLTIGFLSFLAFLLVEHKIATLPMMPLSIFLNPPVAAILTQNFFFGAVYYSNLYYIPLYIQNVRGSSALTSAAFLVAINIPQSCISTLSGIFISHYKRYGIVIWTGFIIWTLGASLIISFSRTTHPALIAVILSISGLGAGCIFQPGLIALQAHSSKAHRAAVISNRNFLRSSGGAVGLSISAQVLQSSLRKNLPARLAGIAHDTYALPVDTLSAADLNTVRYAYMSAIRTVFTVLAPMMGFCLLLCLLIKDRGLQRPEEREQAKVERAAAAAAVEQEEKQRVQSGDSGADGADARREDSSERIDEEATVSVPPDKAMGEKV